MRLARILETLGAETLGGQWAWLLRLIGDDRCPRRRGRWVRHRRLYRYDVESSATRFFVQSVLANLARDIARLMQTGRVQSSGRTNAYSTLSLNEVGAAIGRGNLVYQGQVFNAWSSTEGL